MTKTIKTVEITKGADFYHVEGFTCNNEAEALETAFILAEEFILGPLVDTVHNGKRYHVRTCYEWEGGKWEGFVSMVPMA